MEIISFVILHYGDSEITDRCVQSICSMEGQEAVQLVIVDNDIGKKDALRFERKKKYDFSIPHTYSYPAIITKKYNTEITKMRDIKGRKFSQTGSSNFSKIVEKYNGEIVATNDWNENVSLVEQGRVADENITMIIVTHEMSFAHQISDKVIFMDQGQIVESSTAKQIFDHPQMPRTQQFLARYRGDTDYII